MTLGVTGLHKKRYGKRGKRRRKEKREMLVTNNYSQKSLKNGLVNSKFSGLGGKHGPSKAHEAQMTANKSAKTVKNFETF